MSSSKKTYRITIVGAGIIGLTTACTLLKEYADDPHFLLTIISEKFSPETTADISAGYWEPYGLVDLSHRAMEWAAYTYKIFYEEFLSNKAAHAGVIQIQAYLLKSYSDTGKDQGQPEFRHIAQDYRVLDENTMKMFGHFQPPMGFSMSSIIVEQVKYLPELQRYLAADPRVTFFKGTIDAFDELKDTADVIINCTGLTSRYLASDPTVRPARGQVIRVRAPWIKAAYNFQTDEGSGYILPQTDSVVLGGTFQLNDWNSNVDDEDTKKILRICSKVLPSIKEIRDYQVLVGLRPFRDGGVRLEHERTKEGLDIVHCYGHSGSGVTLSWGSARDVVEIVKGILPPRVQSKKDGLEHEQLWRIIPKRESILTVAKL